MSLTHETVKAPPQGQGWSLLLERYPGRAIQRHAETMGSTGGKVDRRAVTPISDWND